jgi:hypothetical protein
MKPRLALRAAAIVFAALATTACGKISISAYLNIDQSAGTNAITVDLSQKLGPGVALGIPLVGGTHGKIVIDTSKLLSSPDGILGMFYGDQITIAGLPQNNLNLPLGTLCVRQNPDEPTSGTVLIRLDGKSKANFNFAAQAINVDASPLLTIPQMDLDASATDVPLQIDFLKLLSFNLNGAIKATASIQGVLPDGVPLFGGAPFALDTHLTSSTKASTDAGLAPCADFFAGN